LRNLHNSGGTILSHGVFYITLIGYWFLFFNYVLKNPYSICSSEALTYDFGNLIQAGRCWKKGKLPYDPYHFDDFLGIAMGLLYPVNIVFSYIYNFLKLDTIWKLQVYNLLGHILLMSFFAYHLFGGGLIGLFGALA